MGYTVFKNPLFFLLLYFLLFLLFFFFLFFLFFCHLSPLLGFCLKIAGLKTCYYQDSTGFPDPMSVLYFSLGLAFLTTPPFLGPFLVLAFVWVLCPLTGRERLWRNPLYVPISISLFILMEISFLKSPSI